jgi:hypothetical protein
LCALHADAEYVFRCRVEVDDQQVVIDKNDARTQAVEYSFGIVVRRAVAGPLAGTAA